MSKQIVDYTQIIERRERENLNKKDKSQKFFNNSRKNSLEKEKEYKNYFDSMYELNTPKTIEEFLSFCWKIRSCQLKLGIEDLVTCKKSDWDSFEFSIIQISKVGIPVRNMLVPMDGKSSRTFLVSFCGNRITEMILFKDKTPKEIFSIVSDTRMVG